MHRRRRLWSFAVVLVAVLGACGGGSGAEPAPSVVPAVTDGRTPSTEPERVEPTTSSVPAAPQSSTSSAPSTTAAPVVLEPLTGLPVRDEASLLRPALIVKVDGHFGARPQFALDQADVVIEEIVEGITRFMAVYQSTVPEVVGPVRSARTQDMLIAPMLDMPLFAWSGGNRKVTALVRKSPVVNLSASSSGPRGIWYRTKQRKAPHNLLARGGALFAQAPETSRRPPEMFGYRAPGADPGGRDISGFRVVMSSTRVQWVWDSKRAEFLRTSDRKPHTVDGGGQIGADNVVVLEVPYRPSKADPNSPEAQTVGSGKALVFTLGRVVVGTWTRDKTSQPWTLADKEGRPIALTPGRTWVELATPARLAIIDVGVEPNEVPWKTQ